MSDKTDDPGNSETPATPPTEPITPPEAAPAPTTPAPSAAQPAAPATSATPATPPEAVTAASAATAAHATAPWPPQQPGVPATPRRSLWRDAVSTTGGKLAVIVAAASLGLIALLCGGLVVAAVARHVGDDRGRGPWASDSRQVPDRMHPGEGGPQQVPPGQMPPGQQGRGADDLPGLGLPGMNGTLHGEAVVPGDGTATTTTVLFQRGEVTDVTADKLTVKSTDGFSATYTIGADSRDRLKNKVSTLVKGDEVTVIASKDDATTLRILKTGRRATTN